MKGQKSITIPLTFAAIVCVEDDKAFCYGPRVYIVDNVSKVQAELRSCY